VGVRGSTPSYATRRATSAPAISRRVKDTASMNGCRKLFSTSGATGLALCSGPSAEISMHTPIWTRPLLDQLIKPRLERLDTLIGGVKIVRCLRTAQDQVAVGPKVAGDFAQDRFLSLHVEIDHNVPKKDQVHARQHRPGRCQVQFAEVDHGAEVGV